MIAFDFDIATDHEIRRLVYGLVVPRPIAWVSSCNLRGLNNLAPFSFYNAVSVCPPILMFSCTKRGDGKDTIRNIRQTSEFVVNIVTESDFRPMIESSASLPPEVDEFEHCGLGKTPSAVIRPPRISSAKAAFECRLYQIHDIGDGDVVYGRIVFAHVDQALAGEGGRICSENIRPISRMGGIDHMMPGAIAKRARPDDR